MVPGYDAAMTEDDLIARCFAPIAGPDALGLRDDAALTRIPEGHELVLTKDALVGGVHFFNEDPPASIARKALRVNVSDLAAKGADPHGFLLALALPRGTAETFVIDFAHALGADAQHFGIPLLGGDTVSTPGPLMVSITALGRVPTGRMVPRTGVQPGDRIYVSGTIGDAALGLQVRLDPSFGQKLSNTQRDHLLSRYLEPQPRLALARAMRDFAHGGMDVSDGIVGDLSKMLRASGVGATIRLADVPLSDAATALAVDEKAFVTAMTGGDDYELLAAVPPAQAPAFEAAASAAGVAVTLIGEASATRDIVMQGRKGEPQAFSTQSFSHF